MELLTSLWQLFLAIINPTLSIPAAIVIALFVWQNNKYKRGAYYQCTHLPYLTMVRDLGRHGEFLTYKHLKPLENEGARFLFNVYVPKSNGQTSEIDVIMICAQGIFVFESKNFSGWIFGNSTQRYWYQTLPAGRGRSHKESFYNPIMQNRTHIKHLQAYLKDIIPMYSVVVFSNRCLLKNITFNPHEASIVNREDVLEAVDKICDCNANTLLGENEIENIYNTLYPLTQVDESTKMQHIDDIYNILEPNTSIQEPSISVSPSSRSMETSVHPTSPNHSVENSIHQEHPANCPPIATTEPKTSNPIPDIPQAPTCPYCGNALVLRTASRGANAGNQFYGCSNYPKCKYIKNLNKTV